MRACASASAVFSGLVLGVLAFAACSGSQEPAPTATPEPVTVPPATAAPEAPGSAAPTATPTPPRSDITNEPPDGGVVLNNAMTSGDAGSSDRLQPIIDVIKANRDGFRRCFDQRADKGPGKEGRVTMIVELAPDGSVKNVEARSAFNAPDVETCMVSYAKSLSYPRSPSGKLTKFTYPFDFKAR